MSTFAANKTIKELGIDTTRKFRVVDKSDRDDIEVGDILTLIRDDNTSLPIFKNQLGKALGGVFLKRLEYADEPKPKYKVGDIITVNNGEKGAHTYTGKILDVNEKSSVPYFLGLDKGGWWSNNCIIEPKPQPLKNYIITNITSPEQYKRVQEKLFEMGCEWSCSGKKIESYGCNEININAGGKIYQGHAEDNYKSIPASEFLGEEEKNQEYKITNTIITDVTPGECFFNVQKKLFEMGITYYDGECSFGSWNPNKTSVKVYDNGKFTFIQKDGLGETLYFTHITASRFLGKEEQKISKIKTYKRYQDGNEELISELISTDLSDVLIHGVATHYINTNNNSQTEPCVGGKNKKNMSQIITNVFKSDETKALEYFSLGTKENLSEDGRREFIDYIYETGDATKKGFFTRIVAAYKETKKK